jgi:hypothetical protein
MKTVSAVVLVVLLSTSASAFVVPAAKSPIECECAFDILYVLSRSGCRGVGGMEGDCYNIRIAHHRDANLDPLPFFLFGRHHLGPLQYYPYSHNISTPSFSVVAHTLAPPFPLYVRYMKRSTTTTPSSSLRRCCGGTRGREDQHEDRSGFAQGRDDGQARTGRQEGVLPLLAIGYVPAVRRRSRGSQ